MWRARLAKPRVTAATSSPPSTSLATPPCILSARTVATTTAQAGARPLDRHLMSRNFSAPRSAPKPASVTANSPSASAVRVAITELQPCAILANGPPWISAGEPPSVCTRFGSTASASSAAIAPAASTSPAVTAWPAALRPTTMRPEPRDEVGRAVGEAQHRHHLARHGDVEAAVTRRAVNAAAESDDDAAQGAVVHVDHPPPRHAPRVEPRSAAPVELIVDDRREQIMRRRDCVEVAGEMQVDPFHRHDLRVAAAGRAALAPEHRPQRRLAERDDGAPPDAVERVAQPDRRRRLALARRGRVDRGDEHELAGRARLQTVDEGLRQLGDVLAVRFERVHRNARARRDLGNRQQGRGARDGEIDGHEAVMPVVARRGKGGCSAAANHRGSNQPPAC